MASIWIKTFLQSAYAAVIVFFAMLFLSIAGIEIFAQQAFGATGFLVIFAFLFFNVFGLINWK